MSEEKDRTLYLHGRPSAHIIHESLARTITNDLAFIDEPAKWQQSRSNSLVIFFCWIINAVRLRKMKEYKYFLVDNLHVTPIIYRSLFPIRSKHQKFIVHLGSHTLYFLYVKKFNFLNQALHKWALSRYDALLCEGKMSSELAKKILEKNCPPIYTTFIGPTNERINSLTKIHPELNDQHILIIAAGPSEFRFFYKGMDLMLSAFSRLYKMNNNIKLTILGDWDIQVIKKYLDTSIIIGRDVLLLNTVSNLNKYCELISRASLCMHVARGDAFPAATLEVMAAGLPCLVSDCTGTKQVVEEVDTNFICKLEVNDIVRAVSWYFSGANTIRKEQAEKFRNAVSSYTESNAKAFYKQIFEKIKIDLEAK